MKKDGLLSYNQVTFVLLSAFFFLGIVIGGFSSLYISGNTADELGSFLSGTSGVALSSSIKTFPTMLWKNSKYILFCFILSFTVLGTVLIPAVLALKGYLISFSIGVLLKLYGLYGIWLSISFWGIQCAFLIPCLLVVGIQSFNFSKSQTTFFVRKSTISESSFPKKLFLIFGICIIVIIIATFLDLLITPKLVNLFF